jgi:hypothetical protein
MAVDNSNVEEEEFEIVEEEAESQSSAPLAINTQCRVTQISGRLGIGKTFTLVGLLLWALQDDELGEIKRIITNVKLFKVPNGVEYVYATDIREVFKHLEDGVPTALAFDEISKSIHGRLGHSSFNLVMVRLLGDVRKSGVRWFGYTHQGRKESDTLLRTNNQYIVYPQHRVDANGFPMLWCWNDNEAFELDFKRGSNDYRHAVRMLLPFKPEEINSSYDTFQKIPINLNPSITEEELPQVMPVFLAFCEEHKIVMQGRKKSFAKSILKRWNENGKDHIVPYTPKALDVMLSELENRGVFDEPAQSATVSDSSNSVPQAGGSQ